MREDEGRFIAITNRPMGDGGWVATHADITEQHVAAIATTSMQELEGRRAVIESAIANFRQRVESELKSVSDNAHAMQSTAVGLLSSSEQASQRAQSAVHASTEASANVATAATAATELSASIAEISGQLTRATEVVRVSVTRPKPPTGRSQASPKPRRRSATRSSSSATSPNRPTCSRSTQPSRRRAPARPDAVSRSWPRR